ncbi:MAG: sigma-70 family RNA polymerase sigma factor [Planctomycetales bacterium]|nr:sigma-70 family RNA polymerase sigma factor [Planctomycetales bacterium]
MNPEPARLDPEVLLAHGGFVRGLARSLVRDDDTAADLEQEAWTAALERPPRDPHRWRGWLATVVRNFARQRYRSDRRRESRERAAARPEPVPSTEEILARESARRMVVEAVVGLDEPYRSTIVLRFLEGLPPREVALRQGVPVETVKSRLQRGLAILRERLDGRHGGDRRAWSVALLPLAGPPSGGGGAPLGPGPAAAPAAAAGGALVGGGAKLGLAAALLVGGAVATWSVYRPRPDSGAHASDGTGRPPTPGEESPAAAPIAGGPAGTVPAGPRPAMPAAGERGVPGLPASRSLRGRVEDGQGGPVAGARVARLRRDSAGSGLGRWTRGPEVVAAAGGTFVIEVPNDESRAWLLEARSPGYARQEVTVELPRPGEAAEVRFVLGPGGAVEGTVRDESGRPLPDVLVSLVSAGDVDEGAVRFPSAMAEAHASPLQARTNGLGDYELLCAPAGTPWRIMALARDHVGSTSPTRLLLPGERQRLDVVLRRSGTVFGAVQGAERCPRGTLWVMFHPGPEAPPGVRDTSFTAPVDPSGAYRHEALPAGLPLRVTAWWAGEFAEAECEALGSGEERRLDLALRPAEGRVAEGARLAVVVRDRQGLAVTPTRMFQALDYDGTLPAAIEARPSGVESPRGTVLAHLDNEGRAEIELPDPGPRDVLFSLWGWEAVRSAVGPGGPDIVFSVDWDAIVARLASVRLRVLEAAAGAPVEGASVTLWPPGPMDLGRSMLRPRSTGKDGREVFARRPPGSYTLRAEARGRAFWEETVTLGPGEERSVEVRLPGESVVRGRVALPEGPGLEGAPPGRVIPLRADRTCLPFERGRLGEPVRETPVLDTEGRFLLRGLPPGELLLLVVVPGCAPANVPLTLVEGETREVELRLERGRYVKLSVRGLDPESDEPEVRDADGRPLLTGHGLSADEDGSPGTLVACLAPGRYFLEVRRAGQRRLRATFEVTSGDSAEPAGARTIRVGD